MVEAAFAMGAEEEEGVLTVEEVEVEVGCKGGKLLGILVRGLGKLGGGAAELRLAMYCLRTGQLGATARWVPWQR